MIFKEYKPKTQKIHFYLYERGEKKRVPLKVKHLFDLFIFQCLFDEYMDLYK